MPRSGRAASTRRRARRLCRFGDACREERARGRRRGAPAARAFRPAGRVLLVLTHGWYQGPERPPAATTHPPSLSIRTAAIVSNGPFGKTRVLHLSFHWVPPRGTETREEAGQAAERPEPGHGSRRRCGRRSRSFPSDRARRCRSAPSLEGRLALEHGRQ